MSILRPLATALLVLLALELPAGAALAQSAPVDAGPGLVAMEPHMPVEPAEAAKTLAKRTDVANIKPPIYAQAVREPQKPRGPAPAGSAAAKTPAAAPATPATPR